jgi:hypothetical protein
MSALSRRSILRATAATSALARAPSAGHAGSPPDPIVALGREHDARFREFVAACEGQGLDEESDAICKKWFDVIERIAATSATSLEGVVVKLDIVIYDLDEGETSHTHNLATSAVADLRRLAGGAA